ncbi:acetyl-CoA hydrolase/transferase family protein [Variovorax saccharolyticus]|uniref:acetyl-CoA hydrolase/transferase family protein n=1 Tax=Variovorax saccharolyticus TaxID=3053516 RepID=UPI002576D511|nr:acetyl-CoA hydrolase/transferase C-terminal domain-containing protein [Variovorax sp. J22R187]MDM0021822.1 acetyl-CoA hydrolase/transferase C-terminal domain-containing protein [Variovorax sp. J22R187]
MPDIIAIDQLRIADHLKPNDVIGWPQGPGEPLALTEALVAQRANLQAPELFFGLSASDTLRPEIADRFSFRALNGAGGSRRVTAMAEIYPCHVSTIPSLLRNGTLHVDVVLVQVRPLPGGGFTLGIISDFTQALIQQARLVIALLNPALPLLAGDAAVAGADIDVLVESDTRIIDMPDPEPSAVETLVAQQVAALVPDRATIQLGVGTLPAAVARALAGHRELGVHSGVVSDVLVDLVEQGVVTNAHKGRDAGRTVTGGLFGTRRLRDFAERTGAIELRSAEYTHHIGVTSSLSQFHTINSAIEIDLSGQANAEIAGGRYLGAVGGQVDFVRGGVASPGGRSIIAFPSTTPDGKHSRIVASLEGRPVTTARSDVDVIVTEYGTAHLRGCPLNERARRLAAIAHPDHRDALLRGLNKKDHA